MSFRYLKTEPSPPSIWVELSRTDALNALNREVVQELRAILRNTEGDPGLRFFLLRSGHPRLFCAGADIREMAGATPEELRGFIEEGQRLMKELERSRLITIALVNGACLGGGLELALACDFILAVPDATFGLPEVSLGVHPGFGGTQRLYRAIGSHRALGYTLTGKRFSGEEAFRLGVVWELGSPEELHRKAQDLITTLSSLGPQALVRAKALVRSAFSLPVDEGCQRELGSFIEQALSPEGREGLNAFCEKRKPKFP
jgi:enoyl-CoA hydratase/carnithine racemase